MKYELAAPVRAETTVAAHGRVRVDAPAGVYETTDAAEQAVFEQLLVPAGLATPVPDLPRAPGAAARAPKPTSTSPAEE